MSGAPTPAAQTAFGERADTAQEVVLLFLGILDDGRVTDSSGRLIDCRNVRRRDLAGADLRSLC